VDATRPFWLDASLPLGTLREPADALRRADAVLVTRCEQLSEEEERTITQQVERVHGRPPLAWSRHDWSSILVDEHGAEEEHDVAWLADRPVVVLSAIGNPSHFVSQVRAHGAAVIEAISRRDHHHHTPNEIRTVAARAVAAGAVVFVTHKDWVKIRHLRSTVEPRATFAYPRLDVDIYRGQVELEQEILASRPEGA
jgi:tetraacyldisaccharide 4'-kinase